MTTAPVTIHHVPLTPDQRILLLDIIVERVVNHPGPYQGNPEFEALNDLLEAVYLNTRM